MRHRVAERDTRYRSVTLQLSRQYIGTNMLRAKCLPVMHPCYLRRLVGETV